MQCNLEKFQHGQIEFLTENREGIKATLLTSPMAFTGGLTHDFVLTISLL